MSKETLPKYTAFAQHGFMFLKENETQFFGGCPFCGKETFYINKTTRQWDCKSNSCALKGGFLQFLSLITEKWQDDFTDRIAAYLCKEKGLRYETFKQFKVFYNFDTQKYCVPVYRRKTGEVIDIRILTEVSQGKKKLTSTFGSSGGSTLYNSGTITDKTKIIFLCEGHWDVMCTTEILAFTQHEIEDFAIVGTQGSLHLDSEGIDLFKNKTVYVIEHNDPAGMQNSEKFYKHCAPPHTVKIYHTVWDEGTPEKFDIRDLYVENKGNAKLTLDQMMQIFDEIHQEIPAAPIEYKGEGVLAEDVYTIFQRYLSIPQENVDVLDVLFGCVIASRLPGSPLWMFLKGSSGYLKSTFIMSFAEHPSTYSSSRLSEKALISGMNDDKGNDMSLLPKLNNKVWLIKDFTAILTMSDPIRKSIQGLLRDVYDQETQQDFGTGSKSYNVSFGIIAGVTEVIDKYNDDETSFGQRFLSYQMVVPSEIAEMRDVLKKVRANTLLKPIIKKELRSIVNRALDHGFDTEVAIEGEIEEQLIDIAIWISKMRGSVDRDKFSKEILFRPFKEFPSRTLEELTKLLIGICKFKRKAVPTEMEMRTILKVARASVPDRNFLFYRHLYKLSPLHERIYLKDLLSKAQLPVSTSRMILGNLESLDIIEKIGVGIDESWILNSDFEELTKKNKMYTIF
jgi:hypothetical protein